MFFVRLVLLLLFLTLQVGAADAQLLWSAKMENGDLSEWSQDNCGGVFNSGSADTQATNGRANSGGWSARMDISTPGTSGTRLFRWCEPQRNRQLYYSVWYFIPTNYAVSNFWNIWQWKSKTPSRNDPFFTLNIGNRQDGSLHLYLFDWQNRVSYSQTTANLPVGRWFQVEGFYECAADNTGHVTMWQDGQMLFDVANVPTRYGDGDCQWSIDNYSDGVQPNPSSIFIDDAAIGLSKIGMSAGGAPMPGAPNAGSPAPGSPASGTTPYCPCMNPTPATSTDAAIAPTPASNTVNQQRRKRRR